MLTLVAKKAATESMAIKAREKKMRIDCEVASDVYIHFSNWNWKFFRKGDGLQPVNYSV